MAEGIGDLAALVAKMPGAGNAEPVKSNDGNLSEAEKLALAEKEIADRKAKEATAAAAPSKGSEGQNEPAEPTEEEVQAKLDELSKKEEKDITDEEKEFLQKYTSPELDEITSLKAEYEQNYGIKLEEKYDNSPEGLKKLTNDLVPKLAEMMFMESLKTVPYMEDFYKHIASQKSIESFLAKNTKPVFETIALEEVVETDTDEIKDKKNAAYKSLIELNFKNKGISEADTAIFVDLYKAKGELYNKAKEAKTELTAKHKEAIDAQLKAEEARIAAEQEEVAKIVNEAKSIVKKNDFGGLSIPATDIPAFEKALFETDQKGYSLVEYKRNKLSLAQRLFLDYIVFKDFKNISSATKAPIKTWSWANKENNNRGGSKVSGTSGGSRNSQPDFDVSKFDFSKLVTK
jgi:hypothetical protein